MQRAFMLAAEHHVELDILHVIQEHWSSSVLDAMEQAARRSLGEQIDAIHPDKGVRYSTVVVQGQDYAIIRRSAEIEADLLRPGLQMLPRGSEATAARPQPNNVGNRANSSLRASSEWPS
jgi:hypothetical protein